MKPTHLAITLALSSSVVFALRHRELAALKQRSSTLLLKTQKSIPTKQIAPSAKQTIPFSPQSIFATLNTHLATEQPEDAAAADLDARMEALSNAEVRALVSAALLEPDLSSKLLTSLADLIASAGTGENRSLAFDLLLGLHLREQGKTKTLERAVDDWMFKDPAATVVWIRQALSSGRITDPKLSKKLVTSLARAEVMIAPVTSLPRLRTLQDEEQGTLLGAAMQNVKSPADIRALDRTDRSTTFMTYIDGVTARAVPLVTPFFTLEAMPKMTSAEHAQVIAANRRRYCQAPPTAPPRGSDPPRPGASPAPPPVQPGKGSGAAPKTPRPAIPKHDDDWRS